MQRLPNPIRLMPHAEDTCIYAYVRMHVRVDMVVTGVAEVGSTSRIFFFCMQASLECDPVKRLT